MTHPVPLAGEPGDRLRQYIRDGGAHGLDVLEIQDWATFADPDHLAWWLDAESQPGGSLVCYDTGSLGDGLPDRPFYVHRDHAAPKVREVVQLVVAAQTAGQRMADIMEYLTSRYRPDVVQETQVRPWVLMACHDGRLVLRDDGKQERLYGAQFDPRRQPTELATLTLPATIDVYCSWLRAAERHNHDRRTGDGDRAPGLTTDDVVIEERDGRMVAVIYTPKP